MPISDANITFSNSNHMPGQLEIYSQQHQQQNKRKKCRGNRKLQRYRRKLRNQGMDTNAIAELINSSVDMSQLKIDPTLQGNEQIIKSTAPETSFHSLKSIKNKMNINKKPTIIKKQKNKSSKSIPTQKLKKTTAIKDSVESSVYI